MRNWCRTCVSDIMIIIIYLSHLPFLSSHLTLFWVAFLVWNYVLLQLILCTKCYVSINIYLSIILYLDDCESESWWVNDEPNDWSAESCHEDLLHSNIVCQSNLYRCHFISCHVAYILIMMILLYINIRYFIVTLSCSFTLFSLSIWF